MNLTFYPYTLKLKHKFVLSKHSFNASLSDLSEMEHKRKKIINGRITLVGGDGNSLKKTWYELSQITSYNY